MVCLLMQAAPAACLTDDAKSRRPALVGRTHARTVHETLPGTHFAHTLGEFRHLVLLDPLLIVHDEARSGLTYACEGNACEGNECERARAGLEI